MLDSCGFCDGDLKVFVIWSLHPDPITIVGGSYTRRCKMHAEDFFIGFGLKFQSVCL